MMRSLLVKSALQAYLFESSPFENVPVVPFGLLNIYPLIVRIVGVIFNQWIVDNKDVSLVLFILVMLN